MRPMETTTPDARVSPRARRALPLIVAAVLVAALASVAYLRPSLPQAVKMSAPARAPGAALLSNDYAAAYSFLSSSLGWALVGDQTSAAPSFSVFTG